MRGEGKDRLEVEKELGGVGERAAQGKQPIAVWGAPGVWEISADFVNLSLSDPLLAYTPEINTK